MKGQRGGRKIEPGGIKEGGKNRYRGISRKRGEKGTGQGGGENEGKKRGHRKPLRGKEGGREEREVWIQILSKLNNLE